MAGRQPTVEEWSGVDVSVSQVDAELARLRAETTDTEGHPQQRTSVMTHIAWVPPEWLDAAERTLAGMGERHPSRTVILVPHPEAESGIDAELSVRSFPVRERSIAGEVVELTLRGDRCLAPASIVLPLAISDLPVFLRWRGEPPFGETQWEQLVGVADRVVVDSSEWEELRYADLVRAFTHAAVSDIAWARTADWRIELAGRWPAIAGQAIAIRGPRAEAALLRGWLASRLDRDLAPVAVASELGVTLDGHEVVHHPEEPVTPSDLLSAELDNLARDHVYEAAVEAAV
jgi:glucose-6-phosphate dehydrogenase assembly protein OpcA